MAIRSNIEYITELYDLYSEEVFIVALKFFRDYHRAQDILQDVFESLLKKPDSLPLDSPKKMSRWIYKVTFRKCIDQHRSMKRYNKMLQEYSQTRKPYMSSYEEELDNILLREIMDEVIDALEPKKRLLYILHTFANVTITELAQVSGQSFEQVRYLVMKTNETIYKKAMEKKIEL